MENVYGIAIAVMAVLGALASLVGFLIPITNRPSKTLNVNDQSSDSMHDEFVSELKKAKRRYFLNKVFYYSLSSISVIGSVMVSTVYFNQAFNEQIGIFGFFILLSSLVILVFRPMEKFQQAKRDMLFLKRAERDYMILEDVQDRNTFLRKILNEYDNRPILD